MGTEGIIYYSGSKAEGLSKEEAISAVLHFLILLVNIEVRDKFKYDNSNEIQVMLFNVVHECASATADLVVCPRSIVKFFHARNSCDCLEEIYTHLRKTVPPTILAAMGLQYQSIKKLAHDATVLSVALVNVSG